MDDRTKQEIERKAQRVLNEIGYREPPVRIDDVLNHLHLHREYYDLNDPSLGEEIRHQLKVGVERFVNVLRKIKFLAATIPEERRIFIDREIHSHKQKWATLHEATHNLLPWHKAFYSYIDTAESLSPEFQEQLEQEANYGAKRLLFAGDRFQQMALELPPSMQTVSHLKTSYESSWEATLRNYVETTTNVPLFLLVCPPFWEKSHPCHSRGWRYFVRSKYCANMFPSLRTNKIIALIDRAAITPASIQTTEPIPFIATDIAGNRHEFIIELLHNEYDVFVLALPQRPIPYSVLFAQKVV